MRELEEDMPISSGDDMHVGVFPARISMSGRHDRKTQPLLMFGFDRNGLQVGQVTSWVCVVGFSLFFHCVFWVHCVQAFGPLQTWHTSRAIHLPRDRHS